MSEDFDGGGLVDPGAIMRIGPPGEDNYTSLPGRAAAVKSQCTCKQSRWALVTLWDEDALCPKCDLGEVPERPLRDAFRQVAAMLAYPLRRQE